MAFLKSPERIAGAVLLCLALCGGVSLRAVDATAWKTRQTLHVESAGVTSVTLPPETLDAARADHGDIRLVDSAGQEIAFVLQHGARPSARPVAARSFRSALTGAETQLVIDCGEFPASEIVLESPPGDFLKRARVDASSDGDAWRGVAEGVPLFRQGGVTRLTVPASARFVRLTLDDSRSRPVAFTGAKIIPAPEPSAATAPLGARIARREEFAGETVLTLELAAAHVPLDTLTFATPERLFSRRVSVAARELRDETAVERTMANGTIYTLAGDGAAAATNAQRTVALGFIAPSRELLVHIANDDSPPLAVTAVAVSRFEVTLTFDAATGGDYALLTGNALASAPRYDVARLGLGQPSRTGIATVGPLAPNPVYRSPEALAGTPLLGGPLDPAPWSFRKAVNLVAGGVHQLELDLDVLAHAQPGFADVRLLREGAQVPYLLERPALSRSLELPLAAANDPKRPRVSRWEIKLPRRRLPITQLTLASPTALFQRRLQVFEKITDDRGNAYDATLASAEWSRRPGERTALTIAFSAPPRTDTLIVETDNGDNPPLELASASAAHAVTRLLFKAEPGPISLYYGNRAAGAPRYDLALVAGQILSAEKNGATLGAEERVKPEGWAKNALGRGRGGWVFWGVLALVVVVLLVIVAKLLPKPPGSAN